MPPSNQLQRIEALFHAALEVSAADRAAFLADACGANEELRREVEELLRYDGVEESFIEGNALDAAAREFNFSQTAPQLLAGQTIGAYKIQALLGRGGMGVVYRARDERLRRDVAIKVLPASFAKDADRLRRFEQEARATSALSHPNILTIYDIGTHDGAPFIVAELLEGEELRAQMNDGPMPVKRALDYARQIIAGLAAAHEKGIVHRDLKPENLFVTKDGRVKILDFGLAKLKPLKRNGGLESEAPTLKPLTNPGVVLGTVGYMSPEQVRGQEADHRADIFSFGIILHEMLAGQRTFTGASLVELMNAILKEEPAELGEMNAKVSPQLENLVRRCLEKQTERRFHSAHDLDFALEALSTPSSSSTNRTEAAQVEDTSRTIPRAGWRDYRLAWLIAAMLLLTTMGLIWPYFTRSQKDNELRVLKFEITPPENASFDSLALSPDGRWLAFTAATGGKVQLWVRALDAIEAKALPGTDGARLPFWSPDSHWLAFFAGGLLKKIELSGGPPKTLCSTGMPQGGTWNRDDVILFARAAAGLRKVSAAGGEVVAVLVPDFTHQELSYVNPSFLPDGRHFVFTLRSGKKETQGIYLGSLDGRVKQRLLADNSVTLFAPPGFLLFRRANALMAQPFDADKLQLTGEAFSLAESTRNFTVSNTGVLVLDSYVNRLSRQLLWLGRDGQQLSSLGQWGTYSWPWLAPDEKHFVAERPDPRLGTTDLWLAEVSGANATRFTFDAGSDIYPVWSPDGNHISWTSSQLGGRYLFQKTASGAGQDILLSKVSDWMFLNDWSRDGRFIIYIHSDPRTSPDIWVLPLEGEQKPFPFLQTDADESAARLSPNGRWLAYASDESGQFEIYVQRFPAGGSKRQISTSGGIGPIWRKDGKELFYYTIDGKLTVVQVVSGELFEYGKPDSLFNFRSGSGGPADAPYAVTGDGQRFLVNAIIDVAPRAPLTVIVNWVARVKTGSAGDE